jgi:NAD(P)-dependent dehydrogenase (short-subunit alcohol dehydrogenase family)
MTDTSRAVVITGAAGDLGRALCDSFLADGFIVS